MNFFKSILSDDPDPLISEKSHDSESDSPSNPSHESREEIAFVSDQSIEKVNPNSSAGNGGSISSGGGWSFGGLMKSFATRSESMLEIYRRDLEEFGSGLKKETEIIREAANRAVMELPASIEVGASVAQGSLESVGHAFDGVFKSTTGIISQGKETLLASSDVESETPDASRVSNSGRYSRFDAQLGALQNDLNTYCEEPDDSEEYKKWKSEFALEKKSEEVGNLAGENGVLEGVYKSLVPNVVDNDTFWCRYFYRVYKLKQQESMRANLVKRAISVDDEEELSWDVDDDDEDSEQDENAKLKGEEVEKKTLGVKTSSPVEKQENTSEEMQNMGFGIVDVKGENKSTENVVDKGNVVESSEVSVSNEKEISEESSQLKNEDKVVKVDEKNVSSEGKGDPGESGKDSDVSIISSQPSVHEEEDLGWDEIEDLGSDDDKKPNSIARGGSANSADLRKRLSAAEEDEDLSWDIEDDDEPVKA